MEKEKLYGGIDTHKENFVGYIVDEKGRLLREHTFPATRGAAEKFTTGIPNSEMTIAIEACGIWRGAYNIFRELGYEVNLASPKKVHDIVGSKKMDKKGCKEHEKGNSADDDVGNRRVFSYFNTRRNRGHKEV